MDAITIVASERAPHQWEHALAMQQGLRVHGIHAVLPPARNHESCDSKRVICWGWRLGQLYRERGHEVLVMERGYLADRFRWTSLGWNGLNGRAEFAQIDEPTRLRKMLPGGLAPWKTAGDYVLLIGQVPGDASLGGNDLTQWYADTAADAATLHRLPVRFRPHPAAVERGYSCKVQGAPTLQGTLAEALAGAAMVVTFNSNTAVEAVLAGCPAIAFDAGSMAYPVAGHTLAEVQTPAREQWAARLAWCQWTLAEIENGVAWDVIGRRAAAPIAEAA